MEKSCIGLEKSCHHMEKSAKMLEKKKLIIGCDLQHVGLFICLIIFTESEANDCSKD